MKKTILVMAVALILFVLVGSVALHFSGSLGQAETSQEALWEASATGGSPETLKAIDLTGDGEDEVFVQTPGQVLVYSPEGEVLLSLAVSNAKATMGDFTSDGVDDFAIAEPKGDALQVTAYTIAGNKLWETAVPDVGQPVRGLSLDFTGDGQRDVIFGTKAGVLVNLNGSSGELRWLYRFPPGNPDDLEVRGADDVIRAGRLYLGAAIYGGQVVLLDAKGEPVWETTFSEPVRRLRAFDMDGDGTSEILLGGLNGQIWLISATDGTPLWQDTIGSRVNEVRFLEMDGDPTRLEVVIGGKNGGVSVYRVTGEPLWRQSVSGKVLELAALDYNQDGQNELLVAADTVSLLSGSNGELLTTLSMAGSTTLDIGDFGKEGAYLAGGEQGIAAFKVSDTTPSLWFSPIPIGLVIAVIIAIAAGLLSRINWTRKEMTYRVQEMSLEALKAKKRMLREVLEDTDRMRRDGQITPEVYLEQSRSSREELAAIEEQILTLQPDYKPEVMKCPNCGAPLDIGLDRCAYCDHILL